jgi:hypothetical protein
MRGRGRGRGSNQSGWTFYHESFNNNTAQNQGEEAPSPVIHTTTGEFQNSGTATLSHWKFNPDDLAQPSGIKKQRKSQTKRKTGTPRQSNEDITEENSSDSSNTSLQDSAISLEPVQNNVTTTEVYSTTQTTRIHRTSITISELVNEQDVDPIDASSR